MSHKEIIYSYFSNRIGILATMHKKEEVMLPILEQNLGIKVKIAPRFNTDSFGTFTGDVERMGDQLEAAKHKAREALLLTGESLAISSEGSFGPHPYVPFIPINREIIYLIDRNEGIETMGESVTSNTNYDQRIIKSSEEAFEFCKNIGFPEHAVILKANKTSIDPKELFKGITYWEQLTETVTFMLKKSRIGEIYIETDMRAMLNPTRMKNIATATIDLVNKLYHLCPRCSFPGFELREIKKGLLCSLCEMPTHLIRSEIYTCRKCGEDHEILYPKGREKAEPQHCLFCNP